MIGLLIGLALLGLVAWALVTFVPMPDGLKKLIIIVAIVAGVIYALNAFGVMGRVHDVPIPQVR